MDCFFERLQKNIQEDPDCIVLRSENFKDGVTYKKMDEDSGRVCCFLKQRNIGKEDFVMILMPREASAYIALIGVWKCGAGAVLMEEDIVSDRIDFIKRDLKCKAVITEEVYGEMMKCSPWENYEIPSPHDECYAIYTSGSTGKPKGSIHEFGKLDTFDYDYNGELQEALGQGSYGVVSSLNFGPSMRNAVTALLHKKCIYVVPGNIVKNPKLLFEYLKDNKISETTVTGSFFKVYSFKTGYIKNLFVNGEPCTGVYDKDINIINIYTLSEVGFPVCTFKIDKAYDNAPLGFSNKNYSIRILNEDGKEAAPFERGEIVLEDVYTRGYINLPENRSFENGLFRTGDIAYKDENGMVFLCGRIDDMIKINGCRIEPLEIAANIKSVLSVDNAGVRAFCGENKSLIAVYFLKNELDEKNLLDKNGEFIYSAGEMKDKLKGSLPNYMIPAYYVVLEAFPKNEHNKIATRLLPMPDFRKYLANYNAPENEDEAYFCRLFEKVLGIDRVGRTDDFYQIGGDSLSGIRAITECDRFELSAFDLYNGRTPENLAKFVKMSEKTDLEAENKRALLEKMPLLSEQQAVFEGQMNYPDFLMNNITRLFKLNRETDAERFRKALDKALQNHPVFSSVLINVNGRGKICYRPELFKKTEIVTLTEKELSALKNNPCKPFPMENSLLYRSKIIKCQGDVYYFLEIHHLITDGTSLKLLWREVEKCYFDESTQLPTDYFYLMLVKNRKTDSERKTAFTGKNTLFDVKDFLKREYNSIKTDNRMEELVPSKYNYVLKADKKSVIESEAFKKYKGNVFFLTCFLKAMGEYNGSTRAFTFWTYVGREKNYEENIHGMLIRSVPIGLDFETVDSGRAFEAVKTGVFQGISQRKAFLEDASEAFLITPYFNYQNNILGTKPEGNLFNEEIVLASGATPFEFHLIDNSGEDRFRCVVKYSGGVYNEKSVAKFCRIFENVVNKSINNGIL